MEFKNIMIKNFRNYEDINVDLSNKNIFFGMNDIGKTNLLQAIRYVLDKDIRKQNLVDSDYHNKNISSPIEITISMDISDYENKDNQKLRAQMRGALFSNENLVYIKLIAKYDQVEQNAEINLYWGSNLENLYEMKRNGLLFASDYVFNVTYIDAYVDLYALFKKNAPKLIKNNSSDDAEKLERINGYLNKINEDISNLSGIKNFENKLNPNYQKFHMEDVEITIKSEIAVKGLYADIMPYLKQSNNDNLFPTAGEGRKKLLTYSIYDIIAELSEEKKISIFLIEEPENHLHKSMQIALSKILFNDSKYAYMFVSTHSPYVLYEMNNVNLIRIFSNRQIVGKSAFYQVPDNFEQMRNMLNKNLSEAIFADRVLLVEGPSEYLLFNKILSVVKPFYETYGIYILPVQGIGFNHFFNILEKLNIKWFLKTDNDLRYNKKQDNYSVLGFSRINNYLEYNVLDETPLTGNSVATRRELYENNFDTLNTIREKYQIYLSKVDLENDLDECLHDRLKELLCKDAPVKYLQESKQYNMVELIEKLNEDDCKTIYDHYNFACLKELIR